MAKVLIVEDEYLVRVGLRSCIDWEGNGFTLLDDAVDGQDAYQKIITLKPDILLLDLKMPRMDGFELMQKLKDEGISVNIVVLSCCDDFESVRTALRHGVLDYVNKLTINPKELLSVLSKINVTPSDNVKVESIDKQTCPLNPSDVLNKLINQEAYLTEDEQKLFSAGYISYLILEPNKSQTSIASRVALNMVRQILKNCGVDSIICLHQSDRICIVLPKNIDRDAVANALKVHLESTLNVICSIGFSSEFNSWTEIRDCFLCASQIADELFWERSGSVSVYTGELSITPQQRAFYKTCKKNIYNNICAKNVAGVLAEIDKFFSYFMEKEKIQRVEFIQRINSIMKLFQISEVLESQFFQYQKKIINAARVSEVHTYLKSFVNLYFNNIEECMSYSPIVEQAINYITENPSRYVQLTEVSEHVNVSKSYLSQLFKKETGTNFVTFVHRYKINLAKKMLEDNMRIGEICDKIGFENANYFTKIFKRFTGVAPSEYKNEPVKI